MWLKKDFIKTAPKVFIFNSSGFKFSSLNVRKKIRKTGSKNLKWLVEKVHLSENKLPVI